MQEFSKITKHLKTILAHTLNVVKFWYDLLQMSHFEIIPIIIFLLEDKVNLEQHNRQHSAHKHLLEDSIYELYSLIISAQLRKVLLSSFWLKSYALEIHPETSVSLEKDKTIAFCIQFY